MGLRTPPAGGLPSRRGLWASLACSVLPVVFALAQEPRPTFRSGVDVIAVDVQVVDRTGAPVSDLGPEQFRVSIDGKNRKVVSADFISSATGTLPSAPGVASVPVPVGRPAPDAAPGRVFILAFDTMSFRALDTAPAREAARAFVERLAAKDLVGLNAFPLGPVVDVSTDRQRLYAELDRVVGSASPETIKLYDWTPSELVDLSRVPPNIHELGDLRNIDPFTYAKGRDICASSRDPDMCQLGLIRDTKTQAQLEEMEVSQRLGALQAMFRSLAGSPLRKTVVLISSGILQTDQAGGRPDLGDIARMIGQSAAQANCSIHVLHFDRLRLDQVSSSRGGVPRQRDLVRDSAILARPLSDIAGSAGGEFVTLVQGGGEFAFDRIIKETSAYYLLGVEPGAKDRDGRAHELKVKVAQRDVTVRGRSWVMLPKATAAAATITVPNPKTAEADARLTLEPPAPRPLPDSVRGVAEAYARRDYDAAKQLLSQTRNVAQFIQDFRTADPPWPDTPRRARVFALELAVAGLSSGSAFARDEGVKLLMQAHVQVEQAADDTFVCLWHWVEAAGLEGAWRPELSLPFVERASRRCPAEPRLNLARAVLLEQRWRAEPDPVRAQEIAAAYLRVERGSDVAPEALVRAAWFAFQNGDIARAFELMPEAAASSVDPYVRFIHGLVRGHVSHARGQLEEAAVAYRQALGVSPGAQSARVALMALLLSRGEASEAANLAEVIQTAGDDQTDPWWLYTRGDFRAYSEILARLRELAQ